MKPSSHKFVHSLNKSAGFTLVEVVVAVIILLVTAVGVLSSFTASRRYVIRAKHRTASTGFVRQELEKLFRGVRRDTWENPTGNPLNPAGVYLGMVSSDFAAVWGGSLKYTVVNINGAPTSSRKVTATVEWDEPDAQ